MKRVDNISELEEPLWSAVVARASCEHYVDLEDPEYAGRIQIERWATNTEFYVECDAWIRL